MQHSRDKPQLARGIRDKDELKEAARMQMDGINKGAIQLPEFDYDKVKLDSFILVIGKRRFGKSTWAQFLLEKIWFCFPHGCHVFTKTKHNYVGNYFYSR